MMRWLNVGCDEQQMSHKQRKSFFDRSDLIYCAYAKKSSKNVLKSSTIYQKLLRYIAYAASVARSITLDAGRTNTVPTSAKDDE